MQWRSWGGMTHDDEIGYCSVGGKEREREKERGGNERWNEWNGKAKQQPSVVSHISTQMERERHEQGIRTRWVKRRERQWDSGRMAVVRGRDGGKKKCSERFSSVAHLYHTYSSLEQFNILGCYRIAVKSCSYSIGRDTDMLFLIADFFMTYRGKSMTPQGFNAFNAHAFFNCYHFKPVALQEFNSSAYKWLHAAQD